MEICFDEPIPVPEHCTVIQINICEATMVGIKTMNLQVVEDSFTNWTKAALATAGLIGQFQFVASLKVPYRKKERELVSFMNIYLIVFVSYWTSSVMFICDGDLSLFVESDVSFPNGFDSLWCFRTKISIKIQDVFGHE